MKEPISYYIPNEDGDFVDKTNVYDPPAEAYASTTNLVQRNIKDVDRLDSELKSIHVDPIKDWNSEDKPREKILKNGVKSITNSELLAVILGSGVRGMNVVELSRAILQEVDGNLKALPNLSVKDFCNKFKGIGTVKALHLVAAIDLGRRLSEYTPDNYVIGSSKDAALYFYNQFLYTPHEEFWVVLLNNRHKVIRKAKIGSGGISSVVVDVKILMRLAIENLASAMIISHNHPSGNLSPSRQDLELTNKIVGATKFFDIRLLDHVIVTPEKGKYYSFADNGDIIP